MVGSARSRGPTADVRSDYCAAQVRHRRRGRDTVARTLIGPPAASSRDLAGPGGHRAEEHFFAACTIRTALALILEANEQSPADPNHDYLEGLAHYRLGNFAQALAAAQRLQERITAQQRSPLADDLTVLALAQQAAGQRDEALKTLEMARVCHSHNETAWQKLLAEAEEKLAIPKANDNPDQWTGRRFMPRSGARITDERGARVSEWPLPIVVTRIAGDRLGFGKSFVARTEVVPLEEATRYYTSVLENGISNASAYNNRGVAWRTMGEPDKAIADYTAAIRANPTKAMNYANRARCYAFDKEEYDQALADFDEAIRLQPDSAPYHEARGNVLRRQGKWDEALKSFDEAIRLEPDLGYAYCARAYVWSAKGDRDRMLHDLDEGVRRSADNADAWGSRAWLLATSPIAEHRDGQQAVAAATKACELHAWNSSQDLDTLAAAYAEAGNFAEAIHWAEKAVSLATKIDRGEMESRLALYREGKPFRMTYKAAD